MDTAALVDLVQRYKADPESVYATWFVGGPERLKAFRSIRRGVKDTVDAIVAGKFGNDFKGSPLEVVLEAITEQKQVFEGAAHAFYWKPKLRIPDIYENESNQRRFGAFLSGCLAANSEDQVLAEMSRLAETQIKGLGPAVANIIYFLHPTVVCPFNTAILNGFNALFADRKKLGSWKTYLEMREVILRSNAEVQEHLSKDLGAFAGLLFEIGSGRMPLPGGPGEASQELKVKAERAAHLRHDKVVADAREESDHTRIQHWLIRIGRALHYDVHVARNDRHLSCCGEAFSMLTVADLPATDWPSDVRDTVGLIDVVWLDRASHAFVAAFEIEKSTSIFSGILRLEDLARSIPSCGCDLFIVAPGARERDVVRQLVRPAFRGELGGIPMAYILFEDLDEHGESVCKLGEDKAILRRITRRVDSASAPADPPKRPDAGQGASPAG